MKPAVNRCHRLVSGSSSQVTVWVAGRSCPSQEVWRGDGPLPHDYRHASSSPSSVTP